MITTEDCLLLEELSKNKMLIVDIDPLRFISEYSIDSYMFIAPRLSDYQLQRFLEAVPAITYSHSQDKTIFWADLSPSIVDRIKSLDWPIYNVILNHFAAPRSLSMFDHDSFSWKTPEILK